jgi:hypothetical protein
MDIFSIIFKIAFCNLRKSPVATYISIDGVARAKKAFMIIILYTQDENGYNASKWPVSAATPIPIICTISHHAYKAIKALPVRVLKSV